jgi:thiamine kinase-like enzyme
MDALATIKPAKAEKELFGEKGLTSNTDGWQVLKTSPGKQQKLREMLRSSGHQILADTINTEVMAQQSATYVFKDDSIVHHDVRADNCAWCAQQQMVKLTDWSWTQLGDRTIDINAMLVHVHKAGLNVLEHHANRLHPRALQWLAGFWFNAATEPPRSKAIRHMETRQYQLESGITALELAGKLAS